MSLLVGMPVRLYTTFCSDRSKQYVLCLNLDIVLFYYFLIFLRPNLGNTKVQPVAIPHVFLPMAEYKSKHVVSDSAMSQAKLGGTDMASHCYCCKPAVLSSLTVSVQMGGNSERYRQSAVVTTSYDEQHVT
jgi:hypothetical protein